MNSRPLTVCTTCLYIPLCFLAMPGFPPSVVLVWHLFQHFVILFLDALIVLAESRPPFNLCLTTNAYVTPVYWCVVLWVHDSVVWKNLSITYSCIAYPHCNYTSLHCMQQNLDPTQSEMFACLHSFAQQWPPQAIECLPPGGPGSPPPAGGGPAFSCGTKLVMLIYIQ